MPETTELEDLLKLAVRTGLSDVYTAIPGKVESYDASTETCSVRPQIRQVIDDESGARVAEALPLLQAVPVEFPGAGDISITFPIEIGTTGMIEFCLNNIGEWVRRGRLVDPADRRLHGLSGAVFRPGLRHSRNLSSDRDTDALTLGGPKVRIGSKDASNPAVLFEELKQLFIEHKHGSGVGPTTPPDNAANFDSCKSSKVTLE